jgi:RNA polymerase sigma-70 factor (ECF subfamily)
MVQDQSTQLQRWLDLMRTDFDAGRRELINHAYHRLHRLAAAILNQSFPALHGQTDDVHHDALLKLHKALESAQPENVRELFQLAALNVRRVLLDRVNQQRKRAKREGARLASPARFDDLQEPLEPADDTHGPLSRVILGGLRENVDSLPENEREVVDLLFFLGLTQQEAAELLGVPLTTIQGRWRSARVKLATLDA